MVQTKSEFEGSSVTETLEGKLEVREDGGTSPYLIDYRKEKNL